MMVVDSAGTDEDTIHISFQIEDLKSRPHYESSLRNVWQLLRGRVLIEVEPPVYQILDTRLADSYTTVGAENMIRSYFGEPPLPEQRHLWLDFKRWVRWSVFGWIKPRRRLL